jgi:hypothetical protein
LVRPSLAVGILAREFLVRGKGSEKWCRAAGVNPLVPELGG